jgi:SHS2 domain-containing protein
MINMRISSKLFIYSPGKRCKKYGILIRRMWPDFGFREHAHTADWELEVWAPDLVILLEQAARGMYAMSGVWLDTASSQDRWVKIQATDAEGLVVQFLTELLWLEQSEGLGINQFDLDIDENFNLKASLRGALILRLDKEIKAVTYHNLKVEATPHGLRVNIVFDV